MNFARKTALAVGLLYLLTFVSIPTLSLYAQVWDPNYILGACPDTSTLIGATLEIIVALANIGMAVALWEFSLGIWLVVKGFNQSAVDSLATRPA